MNMINTKKLQELIDNNKRQFEGLLPEIIKRLIINSCPDISKIRIPDKDDIWAPGFDGVIECSSQTRFVPKGTSVWEFGTTKNAMAKLDSDYHKRTNNSLGIDKKSTAFILVIPQVWTFDRSITEWENEHCDWKEVRVYDASVICDWINEDILAYTWLMETVTCQSLQFHSLEQAWVRFSNKTDPKFSSSIFLIGRDEQKDAFLSLIKEKTVITVKGESTVDASGFILSSLRCDSNNRRVIVVDDKDTYDMIIRDHSGVLIFADFDFNGDYSPGENSTIFRFNKETTFKVDILLNSLSKRQYLSALSDMGMSDSQAYDIYKDTRGNLRALIRKIPGSTIDPSPDWAKIQDVSLLLPLVFVQHYDRERDQSIIEELGGITYSTIENKYQELSRIEDSPVKPVQSNYCIVNYEEAWNILKPSVFDQSFDRLSETILHILNTQLSIQTASEICNYNNSLMRNLLINYITYSYDSSSSEKLQSIAKQILDYIRKSQTQEIILSNLSILAEAAPMVVMEFLYSDSQSEDSIIRSLFEDDYDSTKYTYILLTLEKLSMFSESAIDACNMLFDLYCMRDSYPISNSPRMSLISVVNLISTDGVLLLQDKVSLVTAFSRRNKQKGCAFIADLLAEKVFFKSVRHGERIISTDETITYKDYFSAIEKIAQPAFEYSIESGDNYVLAKLLSQYALFAPSYLDNVANQFELKRFNQIDLLATNYQLREIHYSIQKYQQKDRYAYLSALKKWIDVTTNMDPVYRIAWMFQKEYSLPADELLAENEYDFTRITTKKDEIRINALQSILVENREDIIGRLVSILTDERGWGVLLARIAYDDHLRDCIFLRLLSEKKTNILSGFFNGVPIEYLTKTLFCESEETIICVLQQIDREDCVDALLTENHKFAYWSRKWMRKYDKNTYSQLLRYNPRGLIFYYHDAVKKGVSPLVEAIIEMFYAVLHDNNPFICSSSNNMMEYEAEEIIKAIDQEYYSEKWAELCWNLFQHRIVSTCSESVKKYFFYHPEKLILYSNNYGDLDFYIRHDFILPSNAFNNYKDLRFFISALADNRKLNIGGMLLGRTIKEEDGWNPHEYICSLMEEINDPDFDKAIFIGFYNSRGIRSVDDGTDQKHKSEYYRNRSYRLAIDYPHAAELLKSIARSYERESLQDYLYSEIGE